MSNLIKDSELEIHYTCTFIAVFMSHHQSHQTIKELITFDCTDRLSGGGVFDGCDYLIVLKYFPGSCWHVPSKPLLYSLFVQAELYNSI